MQTFTILKLLRKEYRENLNLYLKYNLIATIVLKLVCLKVYKIKNRLTYLEIFMKKKKHIIIMFRQGAVALEIIIQQFQF